MTGRNSYLTTPGFAVLNDACISITEAFGAPTYLVGSSTEHADYRDVDLRLILDDDYFDHLFCGQEMLWSLICLTISKHPCAVTGLPVDFQIQRMTEANEKYPGGHRRPMGKRARPFAGGGDATRFDCAAAPNALNELMVR